ncbi:MAG: Paraquat-inducible protein B [Candidatus Accumulibacter sp. BA-94]|uniref:PqiB family protein n=1 Tax=Accumulibacter sp. TaxID=2053492 RepID=UPI00045176C5|nr:MlaD family protein [Accumulibacter sp.]EXI78649.1 MAG: Paraquat-inducible protein B [Candidatus Accumulibacter sp. BA-94]HRD91093.1 MlaD family protein [Accumulibacter sp.]
MAEREAAPQAAELPLAEVTARKRSRLSAVWIIPIIAALLGGWIAVQKLLAEGPTIEISFASADGLEAGKTTVKYNGVDVGRIESLRVAPDRQRILASVQMAPSARDWLVDGTAFWVVSARIAAGGVSGLGTLLSGSYIGMQIGTGSERVRSFTALAVPPVVAANAPGRYFQLTAANLGSLDFGTPIYFRRLQVGQVASYKLDDDGRGLTIRVFVNAPYDRYVKTETRFWQASGLDVSLNADGLDVRTESLTSILIGGLAFDTPADNADAEPAAADTTFELFDDQMSAMKAPERGSIRYVLHFDESVRGLAVGAPMTFLGMPVGEVVSVRLEADRRKKDVSVRARVLVAAYPQRFLDVLADPQVLTGGSKAITPALRKALMDGLVARGLRAQLQPGSLLTGQLYVALTYVPQAPKATIDWRSDPPVFPSVKGSFTDIEARLTSILAKVEALPFEAIGKDLQQSLATLAKTLQDVDALVKRWDGELTPELTSTIAETRRTLVAAERTFAGAGKAVAPDSQLMSELQATVVEVKRAAQSIRVLADYLERHPEALLRGKSEEAQE